MPPTAATIPRMPTLPMPLITRVIGGLLVAVGLLGFFYSRAITALIPFFIGAPLLGCGLAGREGDLRRHFMHAAAVLSLMGALGGILALAASPSFTEEEDRSTIATRVKISTLSKTLMATLCSGHVALAVLSFTLAARARREAEASTKLAEAEKKEDNPDESSLDKKQEEPDPDVSEDKSQKKDE